MEEMYNITHLKCVSVEFKCKLTVSGMNYCLVMLSKLHNCSNGRLTICLLYQTKDNIESQDYCDLYIYLYTGTKI